MRLYAMGEGSRYGMLDYGSVERADTGQVIWQMHYFETELDGWSTNRRVDRRLTLPAGEYRLRFRTNSRHSFDDWGRQPPEHPFWGIALYQDKAADRAPVDCWETAADPGDLGWSSRRLARLAPELERMNVAALMIVTGGQVVYEWGNTANNFQAHSMRKSLLSALYGIAVNRGEIDPSLTLAALGIDDTTPLTAAEKEATVADLLKARSGVYIPAAGEAPSMKASRPRRGSHAPGTFWYYNNWDFNALGTIFDQQTSQENIYRAFKEWVADPIGMQDLEVERLSYSYGAGSVHPYYGFRISARDLARFGQLYLQRGTWQGRPILPAGWVEESTRPYSRTDKEGTYGGYGYMWWIAVADHWGIPQGAFAASGYGGHTVEVLPDLNTVVVVRINTDDPSVRLLDSGDVDRLVIEVLRASNQAQDPYLLGLHLVLAWGVLVAGSLALLSWSLVQEKLVPCGIGLLWITIILFFGPVGALAYWLLVRRPARRGALPSSWQRALGATVCGATGNLLGLLLLLLTFVTFLRSGNTGPLVLLVPFVVGWLSFRAPPLVVATGRSYWFAVRKTLLLALAETMLIAAGAMPLIVLLQRRWYPYVFGLAGPFFWALHILAAFSGAGALYPLHLWLAHRGFQIWPSQESVEDPTPLPSPRTTWGAVLVGLIALATAIAFVVQAGYV
jgi:CubicO group peptidase (beta-lactamase class C family)